MNRIENIYAQAKRIPRLEIPPFEYGGRLWTPEVSEWLPFGVPRYAAAWSDRLLVEGPVTFFVRATLWDAFACEAHPRFEDHNKTIAAGVHSITAQYALSGYALEQNDDVLVSMGRCVADTMRAQLIGVIDAELKEGCKPRAPLAEEVRA